MKILIYGYGNPSRQDDGIGPLFAEKIKNWAIKKNIQSIIYTDSNYQLNIEDSYEIIKYNLVIFVDTSFNLKKPYNFKKILPKNLNTFTTHKILPEHVLFLTNDLYKKNVKVFLLTIKGYKSELQEGLTLKAKKNFIKALNFIKEKLKILMNSNKRL